VPPVTADVAPDGQARAGLAWIEALGGASNLESVDACTTRLRLRIVSQSAVDGPALQALGARGVVRPGPAALQVVVGTVADQLASEIRAALEADRRRPVAGPGPAPPAPPAVPAGPPAACPPRWEGNPRALLAALGGRTNVRTVELAGSRLRIEVAETALVDRGRLKAAGARAVAVPLTGVAHVIFGPSAAAVAAVLQPLVGEPDGVNVQATPQAQR
jgi:N-acetylglucosamine PTS system EIICBA or EIICB component